MIKQFLISATMLLSCMAPAHAQVLASNNGGDPYSSVSPGMTYGQSFVIQGAGTYDHIGFNFFDSTGARYASGQLSIYSAQYFGPADQIGSETANLVGRSTGISGNMWVFDEAMTLTGGTTYYAYMDNLPVNGTNLVANTGLYQDGAMYAAYERDWGFGTNLFPDMDLVFDVAAVPEPGAWAMMIGGFMMAGGTLRARRRRDTKRGATCTA